MTRVLFAAILTALLATSASAETRLFILSGQSNMASLDPDKAFTPAVTAAFPGDDIVVVHWAQNGQLILKWDKNWQPPAGAKHKRTGGPFYKKLMELIGEAMKDKPTPASITFVWMQGEADGRFPGYGEIYRSSLESIQKQLSEDLKKDVDFVLGRISDYGNDMPDDRPSWNKVREAQVAFAEADPKSRAWVDTDDLNNLPNGKNGLHYPKKDRLTLAKRFAEKAIALIRGRP